MLGAADSGSAKSLYLVARLRAGSNRRGGLVGCFRRSIAALAAMILMAGWTSSDASGAPIPSDPANPFNPSVWVSSDQTIAGEHPSELKVRLAKPYNVCEVVDEWLSGARTCTLDHSYEEQDFKKVVLEMPPGLAPDANAAPQCTPSYDPEYEHQDVVWDCPDETRVGELRGDVSNCLPSDNDYADQCEPTGLAHPDLGISVVGDVYMGEPESGDQARLVLLIGIAVGDIVIPHLQRVDMRVNVDPRGRVTAVAEDLPDALDLGAGLFFTQVYDLELTLWGTRGGDSGHPLLTQATSCGLKAWTGEAQGYAYNVYYDNDAGLTVHGFGDGKTAPVSAPYTVQGCDKVSYGPRLDMKLSSTEPNAVPDVTTTIEQADGEATTGSVEVAFPKGFGINFENQGVQCTAEQFEARSCPAESITGDAVAESRLLPVDVGELQGKVYLGPTDLNAGTVALFVDLWNDWLPGGIRIKGQSTLGADGRLRATFQDLPELPIQRFQMTLMGGKEKGLLKNPRYCGDYEVDTKFTSHAGRIVERSAPVGISCGAAFLDVEASTRRAGAHPTLRMRVGGSASIRSVGFTLPRELKQQKLARLTYGRSYGTLTLDSRAGTKEGKVTLVRGNRRRSKLFAPTRGGSAIAALGLSQPTRVVRRRTANGKRKSFEAKGKPTMWFRDLGDPASVDLELDGTRDNLLRYPKSCRYERGKRKGKIVTLAFGATVTDGSGETHRLTDSVKLSCAKSRSKRRR